MHFSDGDLIDFLRGELAQPLRDELTIALASDPKLKGRLESLRSTLELAKTLPEIAPEPAHRLDIEATLDGEEDQDSLDLEHSLSLLGSTTPEWGDDVAERLRARLAESQEEVQEEPEEEEQESLDLAVLCDYWRGELDTQDRADVHALLHVDSEFSSLSRSVQRTLRVLKAFTITPTLADRAKGWDAQQRLQAEALSTPSSDICELIDHAYDQLDESAAAALTKRLEDTASTRAALIALERDIVDIRRVPEITPSQEFRARISEAIADEVADARHAGENARVGARWEVLRGIAAQEHAEAMIEEDGSGLAALSDDLKKFSHLPEIEAGEDFRARIAEALQVEYLKSRSATDSDRLRSIRALPSLRKASSPKRVAKGRRLEVAFRLSRAGMRRVGSTWRPLAAASLLHFLVLTASMAFVIGVSARRIDSLNVSMAEGESSVASSPHRIGPDRGVIDEGFVEGPVQVKGIPAFESVREDGPSGLGADGAYGGGPAGSEVVDLSAEEIERELRALEEVARRNRSQTRINTGGKVYYDAMYSMRLMDFELKAASFPDPEKGKVLLKALDSTLWEIVRAQRVDGSWGDMNAADVPQSKEDLAWRISARRIENTALAVLALLGDGYIFGDGTQHGDAIEKGLRFLVDQQHRTGGFVSIVEKGELKAQGVLYADAIAALALVEGYAAMRSKYLLRPMRRALMRVVKAQSEEGFWRYLRNGEADVVSSAWAVQALEAAGKLGWRPQIAERAAKRFRTWLKSQDALLLSRPAESEQSGSRAIASSVSALAAMRGAFDASKSGQLTVMRFLQRDYYRPSFKVTHAVGVSQCQNANFTAWYLGSLAAYLEEAPKGSKEYLAVLYDTLVSEEGLPAFAKVDPNTCELEAKRGGIFIHAMAALSIENAYRLRAKALDD